jgi:hypothetical protein
VRAASRKARSGPLSALALSAAAVVGCGPGLEAMHESNLRFEHCYRLDMDPKIAPSHREHCWRDWTETYAEGQPLNRIDYARRRIVTLQSGDTRLVSIFRERPTERVFAELGSAPPDAPMAAPAPTSAHEPPPRTEPVAKPYAPPGSGGGAGERPGEACAAQCGTTLDDCTRLCEAKQADCAECREDYRRCMRRCFE